MVGCVTKLLVISGFGTNGRMTVGRGSGCLREISKRTYHKIHRRTFDGSHIWCGRLVYCYPHFRTVVISCPRKEWTSHRNSYYRLSPNVYFNCSKDGSPPIPIHLPTQEIKPVRRSKLLYGLGRRYPICVNFLLSPLDMEVRNNLSPGTSHLPYIPM